MTRKYLNRNIISSTGMCLSTKTTANEFSPYNQTPRLLPPGLLQLTLPRSFPLLYCFQMLLVWAAVVAVSLPPARGNVALSERAARRQPSLSRGRLTPQQSCCLQPHNHNPSLMLSKSSAWILLYQGTQASGVFIPTNGGAGGNDTLLAAEFLLLSAPLPLGLLDLSLWFS